MYVKCLGCCLLVGLVLQSADAQSVGLGKCPENIKVVNDFDVLKYLGVWYEQYRYFTVFQPGRKCTVTNYTRNDDGTVEVSTSQQNRWMINHS
ncbi:apolipoprotein D-like [Diaphorina citri]|uniref:Apolipoprotein D-like n=1 Tax=Diaphorina citri TaxID=121845 RepID=A0A3Q0J815_DIACI|nr:apolipoprotein D-like [Diaphorina citri]